VVELAVEVRPDRLRIEVSDPGPGVPEPPSAPLRSGPGGRGLFLMASLGDRHGTRRGERSSIWVEIDR
jgi:anti-sigma regulatory factor (Ser/Thr protein kinase)